MSRNDEGEFELVLGNRQLVSVFLIVVILLGAFFSMGYLVGRSSSSSTLADSGKPIVVDTAKSNPAAPPVESSPNPQVIPTPPAQSQPSSDKGSSPADTAKPSPLQTGEEKKREAKKTEEAKREEAKKKQEARKELAKKDEPKKEERKNSPGPPPASDEPRGGTFLQVVATSRPDAEIVAESLAKKGFKTTIAPGPSSAVYRVLVGPLGDASDVAETRVRLETAGFKPYVRKY